MVALACELELKSLRKICRVSLFCTKALITQVTEDCPQ